jgi:hypothetical protein
MICRWEVGCSRKVVFLLHSNFTVLDIYHCYRSCNSCARALAQFVVNRMTDQPLIWLDSLPDFVINLMVRDLVEPNII